jgi:hypothetical protein
MAVVKPPEVVDDPWNYAFAILAFITGGLAGHYVRIHLHVPIVPFAWRLMAGIILATFGVFTISNLDLEQRFPAVESQITQVSAFCCYAWFVFSFVAVWVV